MGFRLSLHEPNVSYTLHRDRGHNAAMYITADSVDLIVSMRIFVIVLKDFDRFVTSPNVLCACHTITYRYCAVFFFPISRATLSFTYSYIWACIQHGLMFECAEFFMIVWKSNRAIFTARSHTCTRAHIYMRNNKIGTRIAYAIRWNLLFLLYALQ